MALEAQNNPFPSVLMVEGDPEDLPDANPASGQRRLAVGADHLLYLVDDAGVKTAVGGGFSGDAGDVPFTPVGTIAATDTQAAVAEVASEAASALSTHAATAHGGLLAVQSHRNGTDTATYTTTSATLVAIDGTNLTLAFTAPASGNVLVRLSALCAESAGGSPNIQFAVYESGALVGLASIAHALNSSSGPIVSVATIYLTGLSAGAHTFVWRWNVTTGTATMYTGPTYGAATMEIWAAP